MNLYNKIQITDKYLHNMIMYVVFHIFFPHHQDHCHLMHRGITYNFHSHRSVVTGNLLPPVSADMSARIIRDEVEDREEENESQLFQFHLRDGSLAVKIQVYNLNEPVGLQDLPAATRL